VPRFWDVVGAVGGDDGEDAVGKDVRPGRDESPAALRE